jgi:hypothetical protein
LTTIAANKEEIACDLQGTHNGGYKLKLVTKIQEYMLAEIWPVPFYVGLAGNLDVFSDVFDWFRDPSEWKKPPGMKGTEGLILTQDGHIFTFGNPAKWIKLNQSIYAIGSGAPFALAAMDAGKTPSEAVKIASKHDPNTGMGVKKYLRRE